MSHTIIQTAVERAIINAKKSTMVHRHGAVIIDYYGKCSFRRME